MTLPFRIRPGASTPCLPEMRRKPVDRTGEAEELPTKSPPPMRMGRTEGGPFIDTPGGWRDEGWRDQPRPTVKAGFGLLVPAGKKPPLVRFAPVALR